MIQLLPNDDDTVLHERYDCIEIVSCKDERDFLDQIRITNTRWGDGITCPWVFRGHQNGEWRLRPPAWRKSGRDKLTHLQEKYAEILSKKWKERTQQPDPQYQSTAIEVCAQLSAVAEFSALCNDIGLYIPILDMEMIAPDEFIGKVAHQYVLDEVAVFDKMAAYAQHHGIPTPLLDWTRDPLVAAYFASEQPDEQIKLGNSIAVWALNRNAIQTFIQRKKIDFIEIPHHNFDYLHAQDALFTYYRDGIDERRANGFWPSLEDVIEGKVRPVQHVLRKFVLATESVDQLAKLLFKEKKSLAYVKPSYDNVAKSIAQRWKWE